jgi:hypothetical protein
MAEIVLCYVAFTIIKRTKTKDQGPTPVPCSGLSSGQVSFRFFRTL